MKTEYIICYDISCPKRLGRLHNFIKKHAVPLQYSVYLFVGDDRQLDKLLDQAVEYINTKQDDLRAYPLPANGFKARLGKPILPTGIQLSIIPTAW